MSRNINRIPIILDFFLQKPLAFAEFIGSDNFVAQSLYDDWNKIKQEWLENPDLRFGQLLINMDYNIDRHSWNYEEDNWLTKNKWLKIEDIKFWGSIYDKDENRLKEIKFTLLKNLDLEHIKAIKSHFSNIINPQYLKYFNKRIKNNE